MSKPKHTPTPWGVKHANCVYHKGRFIADCGGNSESKVQHIAAENIANAKRIVHCVNCHDELVAALKAAQGEIETLEEFARPSGYETSLELHLAVEFALKLAEPEE